MIDFLERLDQEEQRKTLPPKLANALRKLHERFAEVFKQLGKDYSSFQPMLHKYLELTIEQVANPHQFQPYHRRITEPYDYYQFGIDFMRPLVEINSSQVVNRPIFDQVLEQLNRGDNVVLFANHQVEPDPQAISILLEKTHPRISEEMIFVAGHRVIQDPISIPFSMGRNLLCIFSKKYIENPPEEKAEKLQHNQKTMTQMALLLSEGGKCIYVAPSGGRDRPDETGQIDVAPFDPQSIEIFRLMAKKSQKPTHFYPLALFTYPMLPPPNQVVEQLGEERHATLTPIHMAIGEEIAMDQFIGSDDPDKKVRRQKRAESIWNLVRTLYHQLM